MLVRLFFLFVLLPILELAILIRVGNAFGFWPTMALLVGTGALGALLVRSQGMRVLREIRSDLAAGRAPAGRLVDGFLVLVGGIALLVPGLLSDVFGLLLLLPFTRSRFKEGVRRRFEGMARSGRVNMITLIR